MAKNISFGTSGHRGIIGEAFTNKHVKAIAQATADLFNKDNIQLALGYDPRQGNSSQLEEGSFTKTICDTLRKNSVNIHFFDTYAPTPVISWYIKKKKLDGGLILTASHNPGIYNGIKFNPSNGAPAPGEITKSIEDTANFYYDTDKYPAAKQPEGKLLRINCTEEFATSLINNVKKYLKADKISLNELAIVVDAKHGTTAAYWEVIFNKLGITSYSIICAEPRSDFGNIEPNPTKLSSLSELKASQKELQASIAIANDPDGDRHVILDENGKFITPEVIAVIIFDYLLAKGVDVLGIASTVASSALVKTAVEKNNLEYAETAVGFKHFADFLESAIKQNKVGLAVESSGGFTASFHTLEKCGFLPGLMLMYIIQDTHKTLSELVNDIYAKYGKLCFLEEEYHFAIEKKEKLVQLFKDFSIDTWKKYSDRPLTDLVKVDGVKIVLKEGWFLMRLSGTEPLARIYAEAANQEQAAELIKIAKQILG